MVDRRDTGALLAGVALGLLFGAALGVPHGGEPDSLAGTHARIEGSIGEVDRSANRLFLDASAGLVPLDIEGDSVPYECESGTLFSCASRVRWSWIEPGTPACAAVRLTSEGRAVVRELFVNASCGSISAPR